ncbi:MAG TPA: hypothetical protein VEK08_12930 [Planctomycetota bacterium]|nr:hypothetical protein [Planctomycetota bacterium]
MWRQGDILFQSIRALPNQATRRADLVIAEGERTGHQHRVAESGTAELFELDGELFMNVKAPSATVVHNEHKPIVFKTGVYRVWKQREYSPEQNFFVED